MKQIKYNFAQNELNGLREANWLNSGGGKQFTNNGICDELSNTSNL